MTKFVAAVLIVAVLVFCWWTYRKAQDTGASVSAIWERTAPPVNANCTQPQVTDSKTKREAVWSCTTPMSWTAYSDWVRSHLGADFTLKPTENGSLLFGKMEHADAFELHIDGQSTGNTLHLDFHYREYAD